MTNRTCGRVLGLSALILSLGLGACGGGGGGDGPDPAPGEPPPAEGPWLKDWPRIQSAIGRDEAVEAQVKTILAGMTLAQKVGQMTQPDIRSITPAEVKQYYIGSVLNGGGAWPGNSKQATVADWLALADQYWQASMETDMAIKVPLIWGTDAVHGHNNVMGATLFPHNIGLGAANDPELIERIGAAVARQVAATGIDWTFAPTLAVVRDDRWGRTYEAFSEDPAIVAAYGGRYVSGLQGRFAASGRPTVVATAKHYIGDGGTDQGKDQGENKASLSEMINIHGAGYYPALQAGAQTVMASFNSWTWSGNAPDGTPLAFDNVKMHGNRYLLTEVLKDKIGFDGLVVSDWDGIGQVKYRDAGGVLRSCSNASCPPALNAGIDMVMVPNDWKAFIANTIASVEAGEIPVARIDDAVTRILRVKLRAGLFRLEGRTTVATRPSARAGAGEAAALQHRALAREAVRKSLVLLKNDGAVLPLRRGQKVLVVGRSADSLMNQTGGWSLTWQGTDNSNADFPNADSVLAGIREAAGEANVHFAADGLGVDVADYQAVVAVIGEAPYAEGAGDIGRTGTLEHARRHPADLAVLERVQGHGVPVVTVLMSGRPLWINKELNRSDALVAAWLPGTEGKGVADLLFRKADGSVNHDFTGKLSFSWPKQACQVALNRGDAGAAPLFAYGYGLSYAEPGEPLGRTLDETAPELGCGQSAGSGPAATEPLTVFDKVEGPLFKLFVGSSANWSLPLGSDLNAVVTTADGALRAETAQLNVQQDARKLSWAGGQAEFKLMAADPADTTVKHPVDESAYIHPDAKAVLALDVRVEQAPQGLVKLRIDCGYPCRGELDATTALRGLPLGERATLKVPLACFAAAGTDFTTVDTPFLISTDQPLQLTLAHVRWQVGAAGDADTLRCEQLVPPPVEPVPPLPGPVAALLDGSGLQLGLQPQLWSSNGSHVEAGVAGGVISARFLADGANGTLALHGGPLNLSRFAQGQLRFELKVMDWGSSSGRLALKMESPGDGCRNVDHILPADALPPADGQFHTVTVDVAAVAAQKNAPCFTLDRLSVPFGIFPPWDDQQGVRFEVRNIRFQQP
ncbi:glycoside hydrolase family 3 N-terminal domain-containing protein [Eleftheria terrae]|uniref:glycoside hydrolase family 3 N-terminal domain-containing protein n=1 Tax=Eleftheria terrae TaxID=1597781 RepID=UPI00263AB077|nr:glycoside hydrolase family 3 N-terminal domain-containing protein [Eleftheria terrae]WKB55387.1 putative glycoside hydrolase [Eleftheria terrae]